MHNTTLTQSTRELQAEARKALVKALTTGGHKQEYMRLRGLQESMCVLGVACDVYRHRTGRGFWTYPAFKISNTEQETCCLPPTVRDYFGFASNVGGQFYHRGLRQWTNLPALNDVHKFTLPDLGYVIAAEPPGLFIS